MDTSNQAFFDKANSCLAALFETARKKRELHFALALMPELRGLQERGWNTAQDAQQAFDDYNEFLQNATGAIKCRVGLAFYSHMAEASGFYEVPKNMLRIAGGGDHQMWPFHHLVAEHAATGDRIAPNANKVLKNLIGHATSLGFTELAEVFRDAFDGDIRNGYAHADYVIWSDGLHLPKRNGGRPRVIAWDEFSEIFERGRSLFSALHMQIREAVRSYDEPKSIFTSLQDEPPTLWTIYRSGKGTFGITNGSYPPTAVSDPKKG